MALRAEDAAGMLTFERDVSLVLDFRGDLLLGSAHIGYIVVMMIIMWTCWVIVRKDVLRVVGGGES